MHHGNFITDHFIVLAYRKTAAERFTTGARKVT